ncbi:hypothetical protein F3Y22_tig00109945pilonHSYRG00185 [Hibiscus syriacus]|uniref:hAT-like transposase RNase-H fold domain-containing protein n=1 Tax=Hibiscus syriacus TaxID=106335 RepID=A0A6A3BRL0_HIBSY|nr:hypothetical protein F3Y22_tig00109945pilonHSYRG00185 [Hibiscus syriacus]
MSSFDDNGDFNSVFVDSMMDSDEEGRQNSAAKKASLDKNTGKRKRKSKWWSHFSVDEEDPTFASYGSTEIVSVPKCWKFDHDLCRKKLAKMLIVDELPFAFVEREEGLKELDFSIMKVRALVRYVRSSPARLQKFKTCIEEEKEDSKSLVTLDVETRWNSTFLMLESAIKFKKAFASLYKKESSCFKELKKVGGGPIEDDWKRIYGTRLMISNISDVDEGIKKMAAQMMSKYDKYYGNIDNINIMMFVAVILDPRHKLNYVNWIVHYSYDETQATLLFLKIKMVLQSLFDSYASSMPPSKTSDMSSSTSTSLSNFTQGGTQSGALVCTQDWLRTFRSPIIIEERLIELEELEEGMKDLTLEQPEIIIDETINTLDDL